MPDITVGLEFVAHLFAGLTHIWQDCPEIAAASYHAVLLLLQLGIRDKGALKQIVTRHSCEFTLYG
jgi:hypothetical protein